MLLTEEQRLDIGAQQSAQNITRRATAPRLEEVLYEPIPVLNHGFIRVIDYMGDDSSVVQGARVSYGRGTKRTQDDEGLIRYLMRHRHSTPFELANLKVHMKLPIFVARQLIRHRTAHVNEYSARYSILDREFYIPEPEHLAAQSSSNRQGRGDMLEGEEAASVLDTLRADATRTYDHYALMLNEGGADPSRKGLARELARMNLTLNTYTQWYWSIDLHNLLHFLSLRMDAHAQYEIRAYADVLFDLLRRWVPLTAAAFVDYRVNAFAFSGPMLSVLRRMLGGETVDQPGSGLSKREWVELTSVLQPG